MKNKRNILIIILVAIIIISIYFLNNWSKSNSYHLRTYVEQEQKTKGADGITVEDIYTEDWWELSSSSRDRNIAKVWLEFQSNLVWDNDVNLPERKADEIISLSKKGVAYIHWKIWYSDNREGVYISAGSNNKTIVNITEFESLPRD